mmetsp:Transcript_9437/g.13071  ORF Transcript_9437/g.13071 Transcript_9437/m.13071 type:complete len:199 (+) Transcript_9437:3-599(+)
MAELSERQEQGVEERKKTIESTSWEVTLGDIHVNNIGQLRKLNEDTFPVKYADKFYQEIPTLPKELAHFAYLGGFVVGAICGRLESLPNSNKKKLYIMTIGVLVAYRKAGIGQQLLDYLMNNATKMNDVALIYLHVQTNNESALRFYSKAGFQRLGKINNYYKRIEPPDCYVLCKRLHCDTPYNELRSLLGCTSDEEI